MVEAELVVVAGRMVEAELVVVAGRMVEAELVVVAGRMVEAEIDSLDIQLDEDVDSAVTIMYFSMLFGEKSEPQPF